MVSLQPARPELRLGGRLCFFVAIWALLVGDPWCTSVVRHGYYPELDAAPWPRSPMQRPRPLDAAQIVLMTAMIAEMQGMGVIEPAGSPLTLFCGDETLPHSRVLPPIYSTYFLIPKADGGARRSTAAAPSVACRGPQRVEGRTNQDFFVCQPWKIQLTSEESISP
jgi:hypothetical protein